MSTPSTFCPLCNSAIGDRPIHRKQLHVWNCRTCGLAFGEGGNAQLDSSHGAVDTDPQHFSKLLEQAGPLRSALSELIDARLPEMRRRLGSDPQYWLEIGPGSGLLSTIVAERGGHWRGVEIDADMATLMQSQGLNVAHGDFSNEDVADMLDDRAMARGGFDVVYFSQVLEHVRRPARFLKNALSALRPGGLLYVDVPNNDGLTAIMRRLNPAGGSYGEVVPPFHMIAYGRATLRTALEQAGFSAVSTRTAAYHDAAYGLAHARINPNPKLRAIWTVSRFVGLGGNLSAMGQRPTA